VAGDDPPTATGEQVEEQPVLLDGKPEIEQLEEQPPFRPLGVGERREPVGIAVGRACAGQAA
jgi:hypothetical protein